MTHPTPNRLSEPFLTRLSDEIVSRRASVNRLAGGAARPALQRQSFQRPGAIAVGHGAAHDQGDEAGRW